MIKKVVASFVVVVFGAVVLASSVPTTVGAAQCNSDKGVSAFLGFPPWYRGLCKAGTDEIDDMKDKEVGSIVFTVALNIIDIALRAIGIIAVGFIIYGGFRYVTSQGEPENTKKAQDTILKAVIGLVIAMISAVAVTFVVGRLGA